MRVLIENLLIEIDQICGAEFVPANLEATEEAERANRLTVLTPGGALELEGEAALLLFDYLKSNDHGTAHGIIYDLKNFAR